MITPEHAPARTVAIQEDTREIQLTRYGGDIEMNLNLFLRPEDAREELEMKVCLQQAAPVCVCFYWPYKMVYPVVVHVARRPVARAQPAALGGCRVGK